MTIKDWPKSEKPREKLLHYGPDHLSDAELLAILLKTGTKGKNAVDLARELLQNYQNLQGIFSLSLENIVKHKGIGLAKGIMLQAAIALAQRYLAEEIKHKNLMQDTAKVHQFLIAKLAHLQHEVFACLFLDNAFYLINYKQIFNGTIDHIHIHPREVLKEALVQNAASVIFAHNHPAGAPIPSEADKHVTSELKTLMDMVGVRVIDHIVVGNKTSFSFVQHGLL